MTDRQKGLLLVTVSALLFSTPGLFTRAVEAGGWEVTFWRALFGGIFTALFLLWRRSLTQELRAVGRPGALAALVWASSSIAFIMAFKLTTIANVSLIYGSAPLFTALLAWLVLKERPRNIVVLASVVAFLGVATVAGGSLGTSNLLGDALALWMTITMAVQFVIFRMHPATSSTGTTIIACLLVLLPGLVFGQPFEVSANEILVLALFGLVFVVASVMLNEGSKILPSSETALISNLEVPIQPLLAYAIFTELPPQATFIGGALILIAVLASQLGATKREA